MSNTRPRLWETLRIDAGSLDAERSDGREIAGSGDLTISADPSGFTVTNASDTDASVLVTLMAKATDADAKASRERLLLLTSSELSTTPLRVPLEGDSNAYAHLWQDDIEVSERAAGWTATRSGIVVLPVPAGSSFVLAHDAAALRLGIVVAAVAAVGAGLVDVPLTSVARGSSASIGEAPAPRD